ncbi:MAG: DUF1428 domain-containing protein [Parvularculaceae bacterium]
MTYVDGFVAPVPTANKDAYLKHAELAASVFKEHGAVSVVESWGDDVPKGEVTDFHRAVAAKDDEAVVFSWVTWPDKAARDAGWKKVMDDPRMSPEQNPMPLDGKRLIYGGFERILER